GQLGRQKMPVVLTAKTNRPSKAASRVATARHQVRGGAPARLYRAADESAIWMLRLMPSHYASGRLADYPNLAAKADTGRSGRADALEYPLPCRTQESFATFCCCWDWPRSLLF